VFCTSEVNLNIPAPTDSTVVLRNAAYCLRSRGEWKGKTGLEPLRRVLLHVSEYQIFLFDYIYILEANIGIAAIFQPIGLVAK
jgi:hypothetical protein